MANVFQDVAVRKPSSNSFNLSHDVKMTLPMGYLVPFCCMDVLPGDRLNLRSEALIRFAPLVAPVMHDINVFMHYFFVPNRIVWSGFEDFMSPPKADSLPPAAPVLGDEGTAIQFFNGSLGDYLGAPTHNPVNGNDISAIPFAAYQAIYNEYYRDQNLIDEIPYKLSDGDNNATFAPLTAIRKRSWMHDYFTSSLSFAQKGQAVSLPLIGNQADIVVNRATAGASGGANISWDSNETPVRTILAVEQDRPGFPDGGLFIDGEDIQAQATTINDLRRAIKLQEFLEKQARGGSRYIEQVRMHFGVRSSDARLQRPEFLGGYKNPVIISEVLQTSSSDETTPQANMAGHGISAGSGKNVRYFAEEHGYVIGIMSVMPKTAYQQGLPRHFSRFDSYDYAWPTFAHIGEQNVLNQEIYYDAADSQNKNTFGYIPRYSEYRYIPSRVAGEFRSSLAFWHLGRIFDQRPNLNQTFVECTPRTDIFAVPDLNLQNIWCHVLNRVNARRNLPKYGTPLL